jgi:hypothetical protein
VVLVCGVGVCVGVLVCGVGVCVGLLTEYLF